MLFPYGLCSASVDGQNRVASVEVHDEITDTQAVKRLEHKIIDGSVITKVDTYTNIDYAVLNKPTDYAGFHNYNLRPLTHSKYGAATLNNTAWDNAGNAGRVLPNGNADIWWIGYAKGTTLDAMQKDLNGSTFVYELTTPITVTFPSPKDLGYNVQSGGTEELLPSNPAGTGPVTAPIIESVNYPLDAVGTLTNLPKNYISVESMDSFTTALGNTLNLNITKTWDSTNNKWTFSVTSRS